MIRRMMPENIKSHNKFISYSGYYGICSGAGTVQISSEPFVLEPGLWECHNIILLFHPFWRGWNWTEKRANIAKQIHHDIQILKK